jgi:hypothetical protein
MKKNIYNLLYADILAKVFLIAREARPASPKY